jgi:type VI protein secretion system component Hcp
VNTDLIAAAIELSWSVAKFLKQAFSQSNQHNEIAARGLVVSVTTLTMTKYLNKFSPLLFFVKKWQNTWTSPVITN